MISQENFDGSMYEPSVLPTRLPNLLLNGAQGIAVGMATQVPSHNLAELADAVSLVARDPGASLTDVLKVMPGPDLPTGGILLDKRGMLWISQPLSFRYLLVVPISFQSIFF